LIIIQPTVSKPKTQKEPPEIKQPEKEPEIKQPIYPEDPGIPGENPDFVPFENPFEMPPYEVPPPGESF
jgi:hypothetical protein